MKKLIAVVTAAGLLVVGTAGMASAADTNDKAPARHGAARRVAAAGRIAAETIGIEAKALREAVKGGASIADVARSHDVDPQTVIDAIVTKGNEKVDGAVASGKIDAARAATVKERLADRVGKLVNGELDGKVAQKAKRAKIRRHARRGAGAIAAATIGVEPKALLEAVKGGQSVADVARSHDVDPQTVIDAIVTKGNEKIDAAVAADKLDEARAAAIKERLTERITKLVNATPSDRGAASS